MAKLWHPYEQNFINHPKFLVLSAGAVCLWLEGKNFTDMNLTDGIIPRDALRTFRFNNRARVEELRTPVDGYNGALWEDHPHGFKMHDYLDRNPCREEVLARITRADEGRARDRERKANARAAKAALHVQAMSARTNAGQSADSPRKVRSTTETETSLSPADKPPAPTEDRVKAFFQWFAAEYKIQRHSDYLVHFKADAPIIWKLLQSVPYERLKWLTRLMLTEKNDDEWIQKSDRGISVLKVKLNWLNERYSAWEAAKRGNGTEG